MTVSDTIVRKNAESRMFWLIRHAESVSNAGEKSLTHAGIELSDVGKLQAQSLADKIDFVPDLIVTSSYVRTQQTAEPLIKKFPQAIVEEWPVQEFSILDARRCRNTTQAERRPWVMEYYARNDVDYVDGEGAESFNMLLARVDVMFLRLGKISSDKKVLIFTHGNFMRAVRQKLDNRPLTLSEFVNQPMFANTEIMDISKYF